MKLEIFLARFLKHFQTSMKFRPVGVEVFQVDGQTDRHDEASSRF
jgi:hypothetical protein